MLITFPVRAALELGPMASHAQFGPMLLARGRMRGINAINQKRVLFIGDNPWEMRRLGEMIAAQGLQVVQTANSRLGLRLARQQHPDLIVLHIESSGMSALAVAQHLKA